MKVLYLTKYSRKGASSRLRSYQYFPFLEKHSIIVKVQPLFDNSYLNALYQKENLIFKILTAYFTRFFTLFTVFKYDKIVIEKELFPYFFSWFEKLFHFLGIKYIVDYDDAIFHNYDLNKNKIISFFLNKKIDNVMKNSHFVIVGNSYLAERAKKAGAKKIEIIPTVIDSSRYALKESYYSDKITIGWIGSPSTFKYVKNISKVLQELINIYKIKIIIIGAKEDIGFGSNVSYLDWSEDTEVSSILNFDIGIMPLENTPWELGKCSYKMIQYMGCGIPVVASAVGMNKEVVEHGINGFLVDHEQEWFLYLEKLILNENLRKEFGQQGRKKVLQMYSLHQIEQKLISIINYGK
jgi:glycosyltransferase involved in cell wall biosynthesis